MSHYPKTEILTIRINDIKMTLSECRQIKFDHKNISQRLPFLTALFYYVV